jgi:predicted transcriptional regulator
MRRSLFEQQIEILDTLAKSKRPMKLTKIMYATNVNASTLKTILSKLADLGFIKEGKVYQMTDLGLKVHADLLRVLRTFDPEILLFTSEKINHEK